MDGTSSLLVVCSRNGFPLLESAYKREMFCLTKSSFIATEAPFPYCGFEEQKKYGALITLQDM